MATASPSPSYNMTPKEIESIVKSIADAVINSMTGDHKQYPGDYDEDTGSFVLGSMEKDEDYEERINSAVLDHVTEFIRHKYEVPSVHDAHLELVTEEGRAPMSLLKPSMKKTLPKNALKNVTKLEIAQFADIIIPQVTRYIVYEHGIDSISNMGLRKVITELQGQNEDEKIEYTLKHRAYDILSLLSDGSLSIQYAIRIKNDADVEYPSDGFIKYAIQHRGFSWTYEDDDEDDDITTDTQEDGEYEEGHRIPSVVNKFIGNIGKNSLNISVLPQDDREDRVLLSFNFNQSNPVIELLPELVLAVEEFEKQFYRTDSTKKKTKTEEEPNISLSNVPFAAVVSRGTSGGIFDDILAHTSYAFASGKDIIPFSIEYGTPLDERLKEAVLVFGDPHMRMDADNELQELVILNGRVISRFKWLMSYCKEIKMNNNGIIKVVLHTDYIVYRQMPGRHSMINQDVKTDELGLLKKTERLEMNCASLGWLLGLCNMKQERNFDWPNEVEGTWTTTKGMEFLKLTEKEDVTHGELKPFINSSLSGGKRVTRKRKTYKKRRKSKAKFSRKSR
jgi:hypothetical protein